MDIQTKTDLGEKILTDFAEILFEHVAEIDEDFDLREHVLLEIVGQRGAVKMSELSSFFFTPLPTMTSIVQRLIEQGYLKRKRSDEDRRIVLISLSSKGVDYYKNHRQEYTSLFQQTVDNISVEELENISKLITKIKKAIIAERT
jgi:DNA-binding MarR family transcriptional regulator